MPAPTAEASHTTVPEQAPAAPDAARPVGAVALHNVIASFHGAEDHYFGRNVVNGSIMSVIKRSKGNELLAEAESPEAVLGEVMDEMRSLETVHTKAEVYLPMGDGRQVLFTAIEHYAPKIAPGAPTYEVPDFLKPKIKDVEAVAEDKDALTLKNTIETPGWDQQLTELVAEFGDTDTGRQLLESLKIRSLDTLTPEQAVKLSIGFVQSVSKYSRNETGTTDPTRSDTATAMELLREGMTRKGDPEWQGNGVCRNVASNVVAVFEALKRNQTSLSMLNNTYVGFETGVGGDGSYDKTRTDDSHYGSESLGPILGHAWNTITTVDSHGSSNVAIVDATWALDKDPSAALEHMDYTTLRASGLIRELADQSTDREGAVSQLTQHYKKLIQVTGKRYGVTSPQVEAAKEFVFTEFVAAASSNMDVVREVPREIWGVGHKLKDRMTAAEARTLFKLSEEYSPPDTDFRNTLERYVTGEEVSRQSWQKIERLIETDDGFQAAIFDILGQEKVVAMADENGRFRVRVRELHPEWLPAFDPKANESDGRELFQLAQDIGIHGVEDFERIAKQVRNRLFKAAGEDQNLYDSVTADKSDYDLLKNYQDIRKRLAQPRAA